MRHPTPEDHLRERLEQSVKAGRRAYLAVSKTSKRFFFEKKKQKTFAH
jgi:hypothetical protein